MNTRFYTSDLEIPKDKNDEEFSPSLIQSKIAKKFEIRSFFLNDEFYSMAIFSQNDEKTSVDFRNYNSIIPNRNVTYKLPYRVEEKLKQLMHKLKMKSGSIDLIKDMHDEYVFLEVNPHGQYAMISDPCNYYLDKKIADYLWKT